MSPTKTPRPAPTKPAPRPAPTKQARISRLSDAPSWANAQAAKKAWNTARLSKASNTDKQKAREAYSRHMIKCVRESRGSR